jgi:LmbE family N-acetylglucosaminyl deacetylase
MNNVLVIAAHADDEALGCAGTIAKHIKNGDHVTIAFMTNGVSARTTFEDKDEGERIGAAEKAMKILGVSDVRQYAFPDNKMDSLPLLDIVKEIENILSEVSPSIVYTHFSHDLNIDHRVTHTAVMTACRPQLGSTVKKILSFEVLSSTEWNSPSQQIFIPHYIVNITEFWEKKLAVLKCYHDEMRDFPHSRSYQCVEALATLRGATNGFEKAEAFFVERILD